MSEIEDANQRIADCLALANRALEEAARVADQHKIDFTYEPAYIGRESYLPSPLFYRPEREWVNSDHQCKAEQYDGRSYGWSDQPVEEPLIEVDPTEYLLYWWNA